MDVSINSLKNTPVVSLTFLCNLSCTVYEMFQYFNKIVQDVAMVNIIPVFY